MGNYLLEYEIFKNSSIKNFLNEIENTEGKLLSELKVKDLTHHNSKIIWPAEGVYLFRENKNIIYVGKANSMSFTERIPKHFDLRPYAWFNRLLRLICERILKLEWNNENTLKASNYAFEKLNLVLINFRERGKIDRTERLLRSCSESLNKFKKLKETELEKLLVEY